MSRAEPAELPSKWLWLFHGFRWYAPRYLRKRFTAVRLSRRSAAWPADGAPVLVVLNHPSWHDPITATLLSYAFPTDDQYAAIDARMIGTSVIFNKIGFLPVELDSVRGAARFLQPARDVLSRDSHVLWVTAQGRFVDARSRPLALKSGVGHLAKSMARGWVLPVALEYPFWNGPKPEALVMVGGPIAVGDRPGVSSKAWTSEIEAALTDASDRLAADALTRDPAAFTTLLDATIRPAGGGDLRARLRASVRGRSWQPASPVLPAHRGDS